MGIGGVELIIISLIGLIYLAVPAAVLVLAILIYSKLNQIERLMREKD
ncbi:MAG TPA: hypothetical protein VE136_03455 [Anaerolineales bacterium]|jgi:uncharacterized protein YqgC (DUF456 family)|nr:hypothetical protein [Anaerolineales bacterium]